MFDLILKNAKLFGLRESLDLGIRDGVIAARGPGLPSEGAKVLDLAGKLVIPGFVDMHTHLEKTLTSRVIQNRSGRLEEAIQKFIPYFDQVSEEGFYRRARMAVEMAVSHGTTAIRSHVTVDPRIGLRALRAILKLKKDLKSIVTLQVVAFPSRDPRGIGGEQLNLLRQAVAEGADVLGGCPTLDPDHRRFTDLLFGLAGEVGTPLDFHVDETDEPAVEALEYLAEKIAAEGFQGSVTAGHCCSLSAVPEDVAERVIRKVKEAGMNIVTLPSCNLFLMGRTDRGIIRRGVTRVRELLAAGVPVSYASDNVRDPFRPFGNGDMLEEALVTAQVLQMGSEPELETVLTMGTYYPARALGLSGYGLEVGDFADLVVLGAESAAEAITGQCEKETVIRRGRVIVTTWRETREWWKEGGPRKDGGC